MKMLDKVEIVNRRARHEYEFIFTLEAGIMLQGTEIKSVRMGHINLNDSYCIIVDGQLYLDKLHISEYANGTATPPLLRRRRA